jgi:acyl-homoserine-lactone acylase
MLIRFFSFTDGPSRAGALVLVLFFGLSLVRADELARWQHQAAHVTILRDQWGIPHVYGKTDADAVFGLLYVQAEDDFNRIELNYINALGRLAEVKGESELYRDLRMKLFIDPADMRVRYAASPAWLQKLMEAFADGLNYYLHTHPAVKPKLITHFEPWMALAFSEGSIGGDIESVDLAELARFYGNNRSAPPPAKEWVPDQEPKGSNGFAIAPANSATGHALLLINPHTSFYFRPEVHMVSEEGLNAYGAVTWGQFFIYQGFNDRVGWMHTSGGGDVLDEYLEVVQTAGAGFTYRYGRESRPLTAKSITLPYQSAGTRAEKVITAYYSHHGPIVREAGGRWISLRLMQEPVKALSQSFLRTKARNYREFHEVMELRTNSSNNTVYADADGTIAYYHGNFMPIRDRSLDWTKPVDGSNPATEWRGLHEIKDTITLLNPPNGWIQNTNNWPFSAAGPHSPRPQDYPAYMSVNPENPRGIHAVRVLENQRGFTLDRLIAAAYDNRLTAFEPLLPALFKAYDDTPGGDPVKIAVAEQIAVLRGWDLRSAVDSVPTSLAIFWAQDLTDQFTSAAKKMGLSVHDYIGRETTKPQRLEALARASAKLQKDFGTWKTPWGEINRFQRLSGAVDAGFDDHKPSLPIGFTSSLWGSLAAFGVSTPTPTRKIYGTKGNSFVAVVEFGPRLKAKSLLAGGVSGDPASHHFFDQAERYARGEFKDVLFYREDIEQHLGRKYHPGDSIPPTPPALSP